MYSINFTLRQCSNWEKLSMGAQFKNLKTAFQTRNYSTQTLGGSCALPPILPYIHFEYHFSTTHFEFQIGITYFDSNRSTSYIVTVEKKNNKNLPVYSIY